LGGAITNLEVSIVRLSHFSIFLPFFLTKGVHWMNAGPIWGEGDRLEPEPNDSRCVSASQYYKSGSHFRYTFTKLVLHGKTRRAAYDGLCGCPAGKGVH